MEIPDDPNDPTITYGLERSNAIYKQLMDACSIVGRDEQVSYALTMLTMIISDVILSTDGELNEHISKLGYERAGDEYHYCNTLATDIVKPLLQRALHEYHKQRKAAQN